MNTFNRIPNSARQHRSVPWAVWCATAIAITLPVSASAATTATTATTCTATSGERAATVVELYTSEGCSSCPPADRWLSSLKAPAGGQNAEVLALSFHVNYWDRLGWPDRFATPAITQRQHQLPSNRASNQVYTPQVVVNGGDWRRWPNLPAANPRDAALPKLQLRRDSNASVTLDVAADASRTGAFSGAFSGSFAGYWAVLEDAHQSQVSAGENAGQALKHDHVVRLYQPVAAWPAGTAQRLSLAVNPGVPAHPRRVAFVLVDAATQKPIQALSLGC
jgi:hypothetical protein